MSTSNDKSNPSVTTFGEGCIKSYRRHDTLWMLSLFGTAAGAGILFLPMDAGQRGIWPVIVVSLFIGPMIYYAHRAVAYLVLSSKSSDANITDVMAEHFGNRNGAIISLLYFFSIYAILLIYGVGSTNTIENFMIHQLQITPPPRTILAFSITTIMVAVILSGEKAMLRVTEWLVYPLIAILFLLSCSLIPYWNINFIYYVPDLKEFIDTIWLSLPVLVFSFTYFASTSYFAQAQRQYYGENAEAKVDSIMLRTTVILFMFVMFFLISCVMTLSPAQLLEAKQQNISVLSYLGSHFSTPLLTYIGPVVAMVAIMSSFFGHYLGAREGLLYLIKQAFKLAPLPTPTDHYLEVFAAIFFIVSISAVAIANPSILKMIEAFSGPIVTVILFLVPMYAIHKVEALAKFRGRFSNYFVTITGCITVSAVLYQMLN